MISLLKLLLISTFIISSLTFGIQGFPVLEQLADMDHELRSLIYRARRLRDNVDKPYMFLSLNDIKEMQSVLSIALYDKEKILESSEHINEKLQLLKSDDLDENPLTKQLFEQLQIYYETMDVITQHIQNKQESISRILKHLPLVKSVVDHFISSYPVKSYSETVKYQVHILQRGKTSIEMNHETAQILEMYRELNLGYWYFFWPLVSKSKAILDYIASIRKLDIYYWRVYDDKNGDPPSYFNYDNMLSFDEQVMGDELDGVALPAGAFFV